MRATLARLLFCSVLAVQSSSLAAPLDPGGVAPQVDQPHHAAKAHQASDQPPHVTHATPHDGSSHQAKLALLVDGAKNPERIPDEIAYRHLISVTAMSSEVSEQEARMRLALLGRIGLSQRDLDTYVASLNGVRERLSSLDAAQRIAAPAQLDRLSELKTQREQLLDEAAARVRATLSLEGAQRVRAHIDGHVKPRIKIYGDVP